MSLKLFLKKLAARHESRADKINTTPEDEHFMRLAIEQAKIAESFGEVPVGAVLAKDGKVIAQGFNQPILNHDPSAHAEIIALREAGKLIQNYRLLDTTLYVTLEPCAMCAMALVHARVGRVVYGAQDFKTGADGSVFDLLQSDSHNHKLKVTSQVLSNECSALLSDFFKRRRVEKKALKKR